MIWESRLLMTVIDLLIITVTLAALWICYLHRREFVRANLHRGLSILVVGILVIGLLYLVDLLIMWVLPFFVAQATAMTTMTDLHLNYSWPIMLAGILCLFAGFAYTIRGFLTQTSDLKKKTDQFESTNRELHVEIVERMKVERALRKSEARHWALVSNSYVGFWRIEFHTPLPVDWPVEQQVDALFKQGYVAECNDAFAQMYGLEGADALTGQGLSAFLNPDYAENRANMWSFVEAGYHWLNMESEEIDPAGQKRCYLVSAFSHVEAGHLQWSWGVQIDITKRKQAEEALRESETRYRSLYNHTPVMLHSLDAEGRLLSVSDYWLETLGYERDEVLGRPATTFLTDAARHYAETTCLPAFRKTGILKDEPLQYQKKNGEVIDILLSAISERNTEGKEIRSLAVSVDVTERKRAEEALRESEVKFATVFRAHPDAAAITSLKDNRLTEVNDGFERMFGYSREEALGRSSLNLNLWVDLEERARMIETLRREGRVNSWELVFRTKAGEERIADLSVESIELGGEPCGLTIVHDITERKRAEEALREYTDRLKVLREKDRAILAAQAPEAIAEVGLQHVHQLVPCSYANVVIFDDETGEVQLMVFHPDVAEPRRRSMEDIPGVLDLERLRQGQAHRVADIRDLPQKNPLMQSINRVGLRSLLNVPLMVQGQLIGALNVGFDQPDAYTDQHVEIARETADSLSVAIEHARLFRQVSEANTRLHSLSRQLVQAQEAERRHLARELHDQIGQTLTAVKLSLQAVRDGFDDASNLDEHIHTVSHALDQVRTLSLDLRPSMLDDLGLAPALRWYVERQARQAGFEGLVVADEWEQRLPPELEVTCFRVVQEALTNIARHAAAQRVRVEVRRTDKAVELIIEDDGKGFDVEQALERAVAGTSLGLLGMEERVHLAGGRLKIHSQAGHGTEIRVRFPVNE